MSVAAPEICHPAFYSMPEFDSTIGPEVAELNDAIGYAPDPEQRLALDAIFAERDGKAAAFEIAVIASRQNLKTGIFKQACLGWLFLTDEELVVWSAHEFKTAQEAFGDLQILIGGSSFLSRRVLRIRTGAGSEAIELKTGGRLIFKARTSGGGRGLSGRKNIMDEGYAIRPYHMGALLPTLSAAPDPQVLYGSSAGHVESDVLRRLRDRGRAGGDPSLAYIEWCDPDQGGCARPDCDHEQDREGCALDDEARWAMSNPALGRRITIEYIRNERRALPPEEFARERLGWWDEPGGAALINLSVWADCMDLDSQMAETPTLAVDVPVDRSSASIGAAGHRLDDLVHIELVEEGRGTDWVIPWFAAEPSRRTMSVAIDTGSQAATFIPELEQMGVTVLPLATRDIAKSSGQMYDAIHEKQIRHGDQPELDEAVASVQRRPLGESWAFGRRHSTANISPLMAVTLAAYALDIYGLPADYDPLASLGANT